MKAPIIKPCVFTDFHGSNEISNPKAEATGCPNPEYSPYTLGPIRPVQQEPTGNEEPTAAVTK